jgi:hypothetical protein
MDWDGLLDPTPTLRGPGIFGPLVRIASAGLFPKRLFQQALFLGFRQSQIGHGGPRSLAFHSSFPCEG